MCSLMDVEIRGFRGGEAGCEINFLISSGTVLTFAWHNVFKFLGPLLAVVSTLQSRQRNDESKTNKYEYLERQPNCSSHCPQV